MQGNRIGIAYNEHYDRFTVSALGSGEGSLYCSLALNEETFEKFVEFLYNITVNYAFTQFYYTEKGLYFESEYVDVKNGLWIHIGTEEDVGMKIWLQVYQIHLLYKLAKERLEGAR